MHVVVLRLQGRVSEGLTTPLEWYEDEGLQPLGTLQGKLSPNGEIVSTYQTWKQLYGDLGEATRLEFEAEDGQVLIRRNQRRTARKECDVAAHQLEHQFQDWLNDSPRFQRLTRQLSEICGSAEAVRFLVRADDPQLQQLPWHLWDELRRNHRQIPLSLGTLEHQQGRSQRLTLPIRVLAVIGHSAQINVDPDLKVLQSIPDLQITYLHEPTRAAVADALAHSDGWDILFYAGHSRTENLVVGKKTQGVLVLNDRDSFTLEDLRHHLRIAVNRGLQICIFNSCDGLGVARQLMEIKIPYVIYMREPVPDRVAHVFFRAFMTQFAMQGHSIHQAVFLARQALEAIQDRFPTPVGFPLFFSNPMPARCNGPRRQLLKPFQQAHFVPSIRYGLG